jgi:hypothetical protein
MPSNNAIYTNEDVNRFLRFYEKDQNTTRCARLAGIRGGRQAIYNLKKRFPYMGEKMDEIVDGIIDDAEELVHKKSRKNLTAAKFVLQNHPQAKKRGWGKKIELDGKVRDWKDFVTSEGNKDNE